MKNNKQTNAIIAVLTIIFMIIGAVMMTGGINNDNNSVMGLGIALLVMSFMIGMFIIVFRALRSVNYCPKCGAKKVPIITTKGDRQIFEYKCPNCD